MTKITRVTIRETDLEYRGRKLAVQLLPKCVGIWPKGTINAVYVAYDQIFELGLKLEARRRGKGQP